ncbi:MAG: hypothetical protein P0Y56_12475 [Candidatus Andeanibacterium colombiense]|uniref:Uncharacterized protein n=1 Tax=Candidatus Andeanibacterium colombiense TaxID=3121345 RepID=A0AAJ5X4T5_9SPHN|nr:MAG: hypothetical protein P0Y56_12475 [Sphingomonadaceae bacterium]
MNGMFVFIPLMMQAIPPPAGTHFFARTDYEGPGLLCGAGYSIRLREGENAVVKTDSGLNSIGEIALNEGLFSIRGSQYATEGGTFVADIGDGTLRRKRSTHGIVWIYRDNAPGSTDVFGAAVNATVPTAAFKRVRFGAPRFGMIDGERCMSGKDSDERVL